MALDILLAIVIVLLTFKINHQMKKLTDFQALLASGNTCVITITSNVADGLSAADTATLYAGLSDLVTKLETLAAPAVVASGDTTATVA